LNRIILEACRQRGFEPKVAAQSGQIDFVVALVGAGLGIGFLPQLIADQLSNPSVRSVLLLEPQAEWHIAMIWRRGAYLSHAAKAWLEVLREAREAE
jgi:DNA-binding transcriptional LysR family regulator